MHNQAPSYLIDQFHRVIVTTSYSLRNNYINLKLPMANTENVKKSFIYQGALAWNALPADQRTITSLQAFKKKLTVSPSSPIGILKIYFFY